MDKQERDIADILRNDVSDEEVNAWFQNNTTPTLAAPATSTTEVKQTPKGTTVTKTVVEPSVKPFVDPSKSKLGNMLFPSSSMNPLNNKVETMEPWNAGISYEQAKGISSPKYLSEYPKPDMNNGSISNSWLDRLVDFVKTPIGKQAEKNEEYYRTRLMNDIAEVEGIKRDREIAKELWKEEKLKSQQLQHKLQDDPNKSKLENILKNIW